MSEQPWQEPRRQSLVGVAVIFFKNLRSAINVFISVILVQFGFESNLFGLNLLTWAVLIAVLFLVISYGQYLRFYYYVKQDHFILEKGLISREKVSVSFDRIQTVNLQQNLLQRLLGVLALKVDTAGSAAKELEIPALPEQDARDLRQFLLKKKEAYRSGEDEAEAADSAPARSEVEAPDQLLLKLEISDLVRIGLTENHLRTGLVVLAVLNGYIWQYEEWVLGPMEPYLNEQSEWLMNKWLVAVPLLLIAFLVLSGLLSLIRTFLRYFDLHFYAGHSGFQLLMGLLKRSEFQIPRHKVQYLKWKSNPLRRWVGLETLVIKQAGSEVTGDKESVRVPGCRAGQLQRVLAFLFPEREREFVHYRAHPLLFLQLTTFLCLLPALLLSALAFYQPAWGWAGPVYLPVAVFFAWRYYRSVGLAANDRMLILKKGWVFRSHTALQYYKLQNLGLAQSIFQKRRGLASLHFHTAAGDLSMPHLPEGEARALYNYLLYCVESSEESWM